LSAKAQFCAVEKKGKLGSVAVKKTGKLGSVAVKKTAGNSGGIIPIKGFDLPIICIVFPDYQ
jgi:hypothetical protein